MASAPFIALFPGILYIWSDFVLHIYYRVRAMKSETYLWLTEYWSGTAFLGTDKRSFDGSRRGLEVALRLGFSVLWITCDPENPSDRR